MLSKKYHLVNSKSEKMHLLEYLPNIQGNYGQVTDIIRRRIEEVNRFE